MNCHASPQYYDFWIDMLPCQQKYYLHKQTHSKIVYDTRRWTLVQADKGHHTQTDTQVVNCMHEAEAAEHIVRMRTFIYTRPDGRGCT